MSNSITPIVDIPQLIALRGQPDLVIIDASSGPQARSNFENSHLEGARFVDVETQLADIKEDVSNGGRHPLPSPEAFGQALGDLGITPESHVVVYDSMSGGNAAARMWWMLRAIGHEKVQVLSGGLSQALEAGYPEATGPAEPITTAPYPTRDWMLPTAEMDEVGKAARSDAQTVIDVRGAARYAGETEPIDLIAGHIPGAINIPFQENLDGNGQFLPAADLKEKYRPIFEDKTPDQIIVHCGSGITACHTLLAMDYAGYDIPKLYVGSWSEWSRNDRPMITKS